MRVSPAHLQCQANKMHTVVISRNSDKVLMGTLLARDAEGLLPLAQFL